MLSSFMDLDLRAVWLSLSLSNKVFRLFFFCVFFYTLWLSFFVMSRLHSFKKQGAGDAGGLSHLALRNLRKRLGNLRQLHLFTLYLLWLCVVLNIPGAFDILGDFKTWPIGQILRNLAFLFHYYAPIFLAFLLLHPLQWFASSRLEFLDLHA